ncbi:MAG: PAS domain-containing protein [Desulfomonilaceae bacterium]
MQDKTRQDKTRQDKTRQDNAQEQIVNKYAVTCSRADTDIHEKSLTFPDISTLFFEELQKLVDEFHAQNVALEKQNQELSKTRIELEEFKKRYLDLYDYAPFGYLTLSKGCLILEANLTAADLLGIQRDNLINKSFFCLVANEDKDLFHYHFITVFQTKTRSKCELKLKRADETEFYAAIESIPQKSVNGKNNICRMIFSDVTGRKRLENSYLEHKQNVRRIFERHHAIMLLIDPDSGTIVDANKAAANFYGYSRETLRKMKIEDINCLPPEKVSAKIQQAKDEKRNYFIFPHRISSGETHTVIVYSSPVEIDSSKLLLSIVHPVTYPQNTELDLSIYRLIAGSDTRG